MVLEDASWSLRVDDCKHFNAAELDAVLKGLRMAIQWELSAIMLATDLSSVITRIKGIRSANSPKAELVPSYRKKLTHSLEFIRTG
ncbi:hypothetical protein GJ496_009409 [Pomphorhynchus laevis]|nr:hypothetical protein GJ496_009409 [Pomphorhynchus laevis]